MTSPRSMVRTIGTNMKGDMSDGHLGDVMHFHVPRQHILVLGSTDAAVDLLERRSDIYSSRVTKIMNDMYGVMQFPSMFDTLTLLYSISPRAWNFILMEYGKMWRIHRREFHQYFHQNSVQAYKPIQLQECHSFLQRALNDPERLSQHLRL